MRIAGTQVDIQNRTFEIYVSGCTRGCEGCHNPELQDFSVGENYLAVMPKIDYQLSRPFINHVAILGGEPLEQGRVNLEKLIERVRSYDKNLPRKIWLYTGFELEHVPNWVKRNVDYIKCGAFDKSLLTDNYISNGIQLSSANQKIYERGIDY